MQVQVKRTDDGLFIPVPNELAVSFGDTVEVWQENGRVVISRLDDPHYTIEDLLEGMTEEHLHPEIIARPPRRSRYRLEDLMARVTEENLPDKIDFGPPVGRELL